MTILEKIPKNHYFWPNLHPAALNVCANRQKWEKLKKNNFFYYFHQLSLEKNGCKQDPKI